MRIVNITPSPRHVSYASSALGGRTIKPGDEGPEVPLHVIHYEQLWKDIDSKTVQIRLNDKDRKLLKRVLKEADRSIKVAKLPKKPKPQASPKKPKKPGRPQQPKGVAPSIEVTGENDLDPNRSSLNDLVRQNAHRGKPSFDGEKATVPEIGKSMKGKL